MFFKFRAKAVRWVRSGVVGDGDVFVFPPSQFCKKYRAVVREVG